MTLVRNILSNTYVTLSDTPSVLRSVAHEQHITWWTVQTGWHTLTTVLRNIFMIHRWQISFNTSHDEWHQVSGICVTHTWHIVTHMCHVTWWVTSSKCICVTYKIYMKRSDTSRHLMGDTNEVIQLWHTRDTLVWQVTWWARDTYASHLPSPSRTTSFPLYCHGPNFNLQSCLSKGKCVTSIWQCDFTITGAAQFTKPSE